MSNYFRLLLNMLGCCFLILIFSGCAWITQVTPVNYPEFTPKIMERGGYKIEVTDMKRGFIIEAIRIDQDTRVYDAIYFDIIMSNTGNDKILAYGHSFKLITDEGTIIQSNSSFKGGFDGDF